MRQTKMPDEIVIVDGGSLDGTWEQLKKLTGESPVPVKLEQRACNIAGGRNRAITMADADIIAATDAGSFPDPEWLAELCRPLLEDPLIDVTGGLNVSEAVTLFQRFLTQFESREVSGVSNGEIHPSSRNTAFRKRAWLDVGGYPEWLTLAAEDSLFTHQLNKVGKKICHVPGAVVHWSLRPDMPSYFRLLRRNAYGAAEARLYGPYFGRRILITLCPLLLLLSQHRFRHLKFRYLKNFSSACGWLAGRLFGHRPPPGWRRVDGIWLSPEARRSYLKTYK
jgi:cellulose synthase/poly-beta-1,6-N-acetylglucosamine synthase-like glycosyltransferase